MINIDEINGIHYVFPTIDFKFQNTGNATAFLWQFAINIVHAEVNMTPVMEFDAKVRDGALCVSVTNQGWGPAYGCSIKAEEPVLKRIFAPSMLEYTGDINSGEQKTVFVLTRDLAISDRLKTIC
jgi:hypothetical protein